jgi:hypothetical protein
MLEMVISQIFCSLITLHVVVAALVCFDDSVAYILVTLTQRSTFDFKRWRLEWSDGNWSPILWTARNGHGSVTGTGCSSGGLFKLRKAGNIVLSCPFVFGREEHMLCAPGIVNCNFPVAVSSTGR